MGQRWTLKAIERVAAEERAELGIPDRTVMDPYVLAEHHGVDVFSIEELPEDAVEEAVVQHLLTVAQTTWSAALVPLGSARIIVENTSHTPQRRRFSVAHEMGHFLLGHDFVSSLFSPDEGRLFDPVQEKQADHFACHLLVPHKDAVWAGFRDFTNSQVAAHFGVSEQVANWRMSGARKIVQRTRARAT